MGRIRAGVFTLLQLVACVVISAASLAPPSVYASERNSAKSSRKAIAPVERKKRAGPALLSKKRGSARVDLADEKARSASKRGVRVARADADRGRKGKHSALAQSERAGKARVLASRKASGEVRIARSRADRSSVRLVAHRPPVHSRIHASIEPRTSIGEQLGLRSANDSLELNSSVALVVDQQTNEVLFSKNDSAVLPIASLTKLMTGLVVTDANLPLDDLVTITTDDIDVVKGSRSRLSVGTTLTRRELMHLALMSSENRAAHALGRTYPGGLDQFVRLMNAKARELGMRDTRYVEPTGLSSLNQSSARDLATLVSFAYQRPLLRSLSTSPSHQLDLGHRTLEFRNSNGLIRDPEWDIGLQKTGYISEAGRCLVMQARVAGRQLIMVFLDATGKLGRAQDAERVRRWVEAQTLHPVAVRPQG